MKLRFSTVGVKYIPLDLVVGRTCVSIRELANATFRAPPGTRFKIRHAKPGFALEFVDACTACGCHGSISRVDYLSVTIEGDPPPRTR